MTEQKSRMVKITMPYSYSNEFLEESRIKFGDARWLNIMFKDRMYNALYSLLNNSDRKYVDEKVDELKQYTQELYQGLKEKQEQEMEKRY